MINFLLRFSIFLLIITFIASCSSTRLIYTLAEKFIKDEVSFFVYLDSKEEVILNESVSEVMIWHRTFILPNYAKFLKDTAAKLEANKYNKSQVSEILRNGRFLIEETITGLTPYASRFLIRHQSVEAIKFIEKKMELRRKQRLKELSKPQNILYKNRINRLIKNFERFLGGELNDAQVELLEIHARATIDDVKVRLNNRTMRQKVFLEFLRTQPSEKELTNYLNKLLLAGHTIINPSYQTFSEISLERFTVLLVEILQISSYEQREKLKEKLLSYAAEFNELSL